ncbi:hypothetical protein BamIOP4010DRAFT_6147 [Burkholderia ambifaria IOP40-10]|uniref:Uncharacterized protein n=1 Tax=Burkholderia ambifaria IOP40-10 TaxID=396596 RepID=B1FQ36_9BURK|nr:hypothetical protein BamIOP4010DRAFT_6147 [Burkholderia ambifaria IOP40-10]
MNGQREQGRIGHERSLQGRRPRAALPAPAFKRAGKQAPHPAGARMARHALNCAEPRLVRAGGQCQVSGLRNK